ncbi:MAG: TonB-dependent receptor, partial [Acidobacteria bacterium]|nr:TonB-dependent receptor [Acidobacteriota bacterium]
ASANRYNEQARTEAGLGYDLTELGFPKSLVDQFKIKMFPQIDISDMTGLGRGTFTEEPTTVFSLQPNATWLKGAHTLRAGLEMRVTDYQRIQSGNSSMRLNFRRGPTQRDFQQADALSGHAFASFLLGHTEGFVDVNLFPRFRWSYVAPWVQEDWKITDRLTVNLGLRWDFSGPPAEAHNRVNYSFDSTSLNPVTRFIDQTRFPGFQVRGGLTFAGVDGNPESPYKYDWNNVQPRAGFAYRLGERSIVKAGYGRYYMNPTAMGIVEGFNLQTSIVNTLDGGRTHLVNLGNPYPNGIPQPEGSALGLMTALGRGASFSNPDYEVPYTHQFSLGIERQLPWRTTVELAYVGSRAHQETSNWGGFNEMSLEFRNRCDVTAGGNVSFCNERVPNPFFNVPGFEGTTRFTSSTIARSDLARPFPQFGGITQQQLNEGRTWYDSAQLTVTKRSSAGLTLNGTYTFSTTIERNGYKDAIARTINQSRAASDRPHRATISGVYLLPFGNGQRWLRNLPGVVDAVVGGWEVAGFYIYTSGQPWDLPSNVYYVKGAENPNPNARPGIIQGVIPCVAQMGNDGVVRMQAFSVAAGCTEPNFIVRPSFTGQTTNSRDDHIRRPSFQQFDMNFAKFVRLTGGVRAQIRVEVFNLLNKAVYSTRNYGNNPNNSDFGQINLAAMAQSNFPRHVQLGIKLIW